MTNRPTIDFSTTSRETARDYADSLISRVNKPETNAVLDEVRSGSEAVDAYALAEGLLDAMRHVSTRFGQSMQRRKYGERVAHLGYIAHGVLANHADGLPVYEPGERSRKAKQWEEIAISHQGRIADLEDEAAQQSQLLTEVHDTLHAAKRELDDSTRAFSDYKERADAEVTRLLQQVTEANAKLSVVEAERDAAAAALSYVVERLDEADRERVLGYWDGVKDATLPSSEG